jgi:hypothetical protein
MSPLGFDSKTMYLFLSVRFSRTSASVQKQALTWVQVSYDFIHIYTFILIFNIVVYILVPYLP